MIKIDIEFEHIWIRKEDINYIRVTNTSKNRRIVNIKTKYGDFSMDERNEHHDVRGFLKQIGK